MSTSALASALVQSVSAQVSGAQTVDNELFSHSLHVSWYTGDTIGTSLRFYGCRVGFTLDRVSVR